MIMSSDHRPFLASRAGQRLLAYFACLVLANCTARTKELGRECLPDHSVCVVMRTATPYEEIAAGYFLHYYDVNAAGPCTVLFVVTASDSSGGPPSPCYSMADLDFVIKREFVQYNLLRYDLASRIWRVAE